MAALRRRLDFVCDRLEIVDVVSKYCRGLDRLDGELIASCFHDDAIDHHGDFVGNMAAFVPWALESESIYLTTQHNVTTHVCDIDGDVAHVESYLAFFVRDGETSVSAGGGRYVDRFERRNGQWRIALRQLFMDWRFQSEGTMNVGTQGYPTGSRDRADPSYMRPLELPAELVVRKIG